MWQEELKIHHQLLCEKQAAHNNHMKNLNEVWLKQSKNIVESLDLYLSMTPNVQ